MLIIILKLTFVLDYRNSIAETYIVSELGNVTLCLFTLATSIMAVVVGQL